MIKKRHIIGASTGGKGAGGTVRTPKEDPDDLFSVTTAKLIDALCEGPIEGFPEGGEDALKYVYLNGTEAKNDNGTLNFNQLDLQLRFGEVDEDAEDQDNIFTPPEYAAKTLSISKKIYKDVPISQAITNHRVEKVKLALKVPVLRRIDPKTGDVKRHKVSVYVYLNGRKQKTLTIKGKTGSGYVKEFNLDVGRVTGNDPSVPYERRTISMRRKDEESATIGVSDDIYWEYMVEMIPAALAYPSCALSNLVFDSRQFGQIPTRAFELKLMKVKVPSNYDPETREYTGDWDGTFSAAQWTDNPAWVLYDLLLNSLYGAGEYFTEDMVDKWSLYEIAKYCDELLPTGLQDANGDDIMEPRFSCNCYINSRQDTFRVISEIVSSFRGMMTWVGGKLIFIQDRPKEVMMQFTNANVTEDGFTYVEMDKMARYTASLVFYQDKRDKYERKAVYVEDQEAIRTLGLRQMETEAYACTSESQAYRQGRWIVYSTLFEKETVTFRTGIEALYLSLGDVIQVVDNSRYSARKGGRIESISADRKTIKLDSTVYIDPTVEASLYLCIPKDNAEFDDITSSTQYLNEFHQVEVEKRLINVSANVPFYTDTLTVSEAFSDSATENSIWLFETAARDTSIEEYGDQEQFDEFMFDFLNLAGDRFATVDVYGAKPKKYRVTSIKDVGDHQYEITGLEYNEAKFDFIERNILNISPPIPPTYNFISPPYNLLVEKFADSDGIDLVFSWSHSPDRNVYPTLYYEITYSIGGITYSAQTANNFYTVSGVSYTETDDITFNVVAKVQGQSIYSSTLSKITSPHPENMSSSALENLELVYADDDDSSSFSRSDADIQWSLTDAYSGQEEYINQFEIKIYNGSNVLLRTEYKDRDSVTIQGSQFYQYAYLLVDNIADSLAKGYIGAQRSLRFQVRASLKTGGFTNQLTLTAYNNPPQALVKDSDFVVLPSYNGALVNIFQGSVADDYNGSLFYYSTGSFTSGNVNAQTSLPTRSDIFFKDIKYPVFSDTVPIDGSRDYYMAISPYDTYGSGYLNMSSVFSLSTYGASTGTAPARPNGVSLTSTLDVSPDLSKTIKLIASWNLNAERDISYYEIGFRESGVGDYDTFVASSKQTSFVTMGQRYTTYEARVRAFSQLGLSSLYATGAGHTTPNVDLFPSGFGGGSGTNIPVGGVFLYPKQSPFPSGESLYFDYYTGQWLETGALPDLWDKYKNIAPTSGSMFRLPSGYFNDSFAYAGRIA